MGIKTIVCLMVGACVSHVCWSQDFEVLDNEITQTTAPLRNAITLNDSTIIVIGGWGWGAGVILKSTDYGTTWTLTNVNKALIDITFVNDSIGYATGEGSTIMKTINSGESWTYQNTDAIDPAFELRTVAFLNTDTGFVGTANGPGYAFLKTFDGGESWSNHLADTVYVRTKLQSIDGTTIVGIGNNSALYSTNDYGASWFAIPIPENIGNESYGMHFFNLDTGIISIREFSTDCGSNFTLARTQNAGETWSTQYYPCNSFYKLTFTDDNIGFAIGKTFSTQGIRTMWRSLNSGGSWEEFEYPVSEEHVFTGCVATAFACVNQDTCYMPTNYGTIIKMTNATGGLVSTMQEEVKSSNKLQVYPNPNNGEFRVNLSTIDEKIADISIHSMDGRKVYEAKVLNEGNNLSITVENIASGLYVISIFTSENVYSGKFIKE